LLHPDTSFIERKKIRHEVSKINPSVRREKKDEFVMIKLIFAIDDRHREAPYQNLLANTFQTPRFVLELFDELTTLIDSCESQDVLLLSCSCAKTSAPIAGSWYELLKFADGDFGNDSS
jgi:hypothetical protein